MDRRADEHTGATERTGDGDRVEPLPRIPCATYRLQLNKEFPLTAAQEVIPYLRELGVSDVYASPILAARPGSVHGYDVVDHAHVNAELGGDEAFEAFGQATQREGLGIVVDVVPNHMCVQGHLNAWWMDVLEHGPSSPYANHFDIDWRPPKAALAGRVLLPILGDQYGRVLENDLRIEFHDGAFRAVLPYAWFPLAPRSWMEILSIAIEHLRSKVEPDATALLEMESIATALSHLPHRSEVDPDRVRERRREAHIVGQRLLQLIQNEAPAAALSAALTVVNGHKGDPRSFDTMERLLADQAYRLSFWRVASDEINYRRFFDINELAAIRVENPEVFEAVHGSTLRFAAAGWLTGLRIDHVDGLYDPHKYLHDLQSAWKAATGQSGYVVVEKILGPGETLPEDWPVAGTTGYDFLNLVLGLFVDPNAARPLRALASGLAEGPTRYDDVVLHSKRLVIEASMSSELTVLARRLDRISEQHRYSRDFTLNNLQNALAQVIAGFGVYRTYIRDADTTPSQRDELAVERAIRYARRHNPATSAAVFDFIRDVLLLRDPEGLSFEQAAERREFVLKLQQVTGPIMAKGLEDTAFYRYHPLAALNEVGGEPDHFGTTIQAFHQTQKERWEQTPYTMCATATHDTKRGEDTRLRIATLSEMPAAWRRSVERWFALNDRLATSLPNGRGPTRSEEHFIYQTLVGTWPIEGLSAAPNYLDRLLAYIEKALKEAKQNTSWIAPNEPHDQAVKDFISQLLDSGKSPEFLADFERFVRKAQWAGYWNGLSQVILKLTSPGVPDIYQGTEFWDLSLVDPDNRRGVDYARRRSMLADLQSEFAANPKTLIESLLASPHDARIKLWILHRGLLARRQHSQALVHGQYVPLEVAGDRNEQAVAFARVQEQHAIIVVVGRFFTRFANQLKRPVGEVWGQTSVQLPKHLEGCSLTNLLTNENLQPTAEGTLMLGEVFAHFPVALLVTQATAARP